MNAVPRRTMGKVGEKNDSGNADSSTGGGSSFALLLAIVVAIVSIFSGALLSSSDTIPSAGLSTVISSAELSVSSSGALSFQSDDTTYHGAVVDEQIVDGSDANEGVVDAITYEDGSETTTAEPERVIDNSTTGPKDDEDSDIGYNPTADITLDVDDPPGAPSSGPGVKPSASPTTSPSASTSSVSPSAAPGSSPSESPSGSFYPSSAPSDNPTLSAAPSASPSTYPSASPSARPSASPSSSPSSTPSASPSAAPSASPSAGPSVSRSAARSRDHANLIAGTTFDHYNDNPTKLVKDEPVSTFSIDVDTSSYSFLRRSIMEDDVLPYSNDIFLEEMINYFDYDYPEPSSKDVPFEPSMMILDSPFRHHHGSPNRHKLLGIGIKGFGYNNNDSYISNDEDSRPFSNIVFLVDVSRSMYSKDKLPLAKEAMKMLVSESLREGDCISIVTYASNVNVVLYPTCLGGDSLDSDKEDDRIKSGVTERDTIITAIDSLKAGGATWGTGGIEQAYKVAEMKFDPDDTISRIIVLTDGDFNLGLTGREELESYVATKRSSGIFLSLLGFGMYGYNDSTMKALADKGNGVAAYIDTVEEARKVMVTESQSTLFTIAKDVKIQIEFDPLHVEEYRLLGYEKRCLNQEDFHNDHVDAGEIGAGHTVTAFYEIMLRSDVKRSVLIEQYESYMQQQTGVVVENGHETTNDHENDPLKNDEIGSLMIRYKLPHEDASKLIKKPLSKTTIKKLDFDNDDFKVDSDSQLDQLLLLYQEFSFAATVAYYVQALKDFGTSCKYANGGVEVFDEIIEMAQTFKGEDKFGYRQQFTDIVNKTKNILHRRAVLAHCV